MIVVGLAAGGIAAGLALDQPRLEDVPRRVTPPKDAKLSREEPSKPAPALSLAALADLSLDSCLDHPADVPATPPESYGCAALTYNADGTCTLESVTIENWRPVSVRRTVVRCP